MICSDKIKAEYNVLVYLKIQKLNVGNIKNQVQPKIIKL